MNFSNLRVIADSLSCSSFHLMTKKKNTLVKRRKNLYKIILKKGLKFIVSFTTVRFFFGRKVYLLTLFQSSRSFFFCRTSRTDLGGVWATACFQICEKNVGSRHSGRWCLAEYNLWEILAVELFMASNGDIYSLNSYRTQTCIAYLRRQLE